ncbi:MAG: hypothetical protein CVV22_02635 [Ignavibacteriae bacterium HGW-Ignavibacteriae-1]|jgi:hypothetical protein|nr:MAG: hypothetical protein CVV22_02635 [Ignavibacteriae bacterium HGW-Ignavibacteriae-1]
MLKKADTHAIVSLLILAYLIVGFTFQKQISQNEGKGFDGVYYYQLATDFVNNETPTAKSPFVYRIGTPYVVSVFFPNDLMTGFKAINLVFAVFSIFLLLVFLRLYIDDERIIVLLVALYIIYWQAPLRLSIYYPVHTDPASITFMLASLIAVTNIIRDKSKRGNLILLTLLTGVGVLFREICLVPAMALAFSSFVSLKEQKFALNFPQKKQLTYFIPMIIGLLGYFIILLFVNKSDDSTFFGATLGWLYEKSASKYLHALMMAFGPILILAIYNIRNGIQFLKSEPHLLFFVVAMLLVGWVGGSDTERLLYWSMPVVYILIGKFLSERGKLLNWQIIALIAITQLISTRAFLFIPDYPNDFSSVIPFLTPLTNEFPLFDLWSWHGNQKMNIFSFIQYTALFGALFWMLKHANSKQSNNLKK